MTDRPPKGTPTCTLCKRTDQLCGVNNDWYCPDHITIGIGKAFAPVRTAIQHALDR